MNVDARYGQMDIQIWIDGYIDMDRCREMWIYRFQIEGYKKGLISSLYEGMQL